MSVPYEALNTVGFGTLSALEHRLRTLVVDDAPAMLEATCCVLEFQGMVEIVGRAHDGLEALQAVAELRPELVIMDVRMPKMDGLQAAGLMAEHFSETRIVLMSGEPTPELPELCRAAGADAFLFKLDFPQAVGPVLQRLFGDPRLRPVA